MAWYDFLFGEPFPKPAPDPVYEYEVRTETPASKPGTRPGSIQTSMDDVVFSVSDKGGLSCYIQNKWMWSVEGSSRHYLLEKLKKAVAMADLADPENTMEALIKKYNEEQAKKTLTPDPKGDTKTT